MRNIWNSNKHLYRQLSYFSDPANEESMNLNNFHTLYNLKNYKFAILGILINSLYGILLSHQQNMQYV